MHPVAAKPSVAMQQIFIKRTAILIKFSMADIDTPLVTTQFSIFR
jgi:hypothetical protein